MHLLRITTLAMAALTAVPPNALADERVTLQLRGGERVAGRFDGLTNGLLYLDVSDTDERKIPIGDVALIDLVGGAQGLPETELAAARQSSHLLLLRDGSSVRGQLQEITGSERQKENPSPTTVVFRTTSGEERRVPLRSVARLYLGNYPDAGSTTSAQPSASPASAPGTVQVAANQRWVDTGIVVTKGQGVRFEASGEVRLSTDEGDVAVPAGSKRGRRAANAPLPGTLAGALIGRVGNGVPFGVGDQSGPLPMPAAGRLYLAVNDDEVGDNAGAFTVRVTPDASPLTRPGSRRRPSN